MSDTWAAAKQARCYRTCQKRHSRCSTNRGLRLGIQERHALGSEAVEVGRMERATIHRLHTFEGSEVVHDDEQDVAQACSCPHGPRRYTHEDPLQCEAARTCMLWLLHGHPRRVAQRQVCVVQRRVTLGRAYPW